MSDILTLRERIEQMYGQVLSVMEENRQKGIRHIYIFLDFDGVINLFYAEGTPAYEKFLEKVQNRDLEFYDTECVQRFSDLCIQNDADVIISSSWRYNGIDFCIDYLKKAGLKDGVNIVGITEVDWVHTREELICSYLLEHPDFSSFIILDDMSMTTLQNHLIQTEPYTGFDEEHYLMAEGLLRSR